MGSQRKHRKPHQKKSNWLKNERKTISGGENMNDLHRAIAKRKGRDPEFAKTFDKEYEEFKIGVLLKEARKNAGLTQEALADKLNTKKSAISRIENHSEDIRLSTLHHYAEALGKKIQVSIL